MPFARVAVLGYSWLNRSCRKPAFFRKRREWPCFPTALIFSKRNLHVDCDTTQLDINEK